jgi:predicted transcriptional regulator
MKTLRIGIASYNDMKTRTLEIARGTRRPARDEPSVWFTSAESFARVLSDRNRALLDLIAETGPESIAELAEKTGRRKSNLSRTLHTMEHYGLVVLKKASKGRIVPSVPYSSIALVMPIGVPAITSFK